jgi:hypothetical protein
MFTTRPAFSGTRDTEYSEKAEAAALSKHRGAVVPVPLHWEAWDQKAKEES